MEADDALVPILQSADYREDVSRESTDLNSHHVRNLLTVNGLLFLLHTSDFMYGPCITQFIYVKISSELLGNASTASRRPCFKNTSSPEYENEEHAQELTSQKMLQFTLVFSFVSLVSNLFLGAYSDYFGRRFLFFVVIFGIVCRNVNAAVVARMEMDINWIYLGGLIHSCCGSYFALILAVSAYTADNTTANSSRTVWLALIGVVEGMASVVGQLGGGYFIRETGFFYPFLTSGIISVVVFVMMFFFLKETHVRPSRDVTRFPTPLQAVKDVFGFYFLQSTSKELEERSPAKQTVARRANIQRKQRLEICLFFLVLLPPIGAYNIETLYLINIPFCWESNKIGTYLTLKIVLSHCFSLLLVKLLTRITRDELVGLIGLVSSASGFLLMGFAYEDWMVYVASAVGSLISLAPVVIRSKLSQGTPSDKQGSQFAGQAVVASLCSVAGSVLFNAVYSNTVAHFRGATYFLLAGVTVLVLLVFGYYTYVFRQKGHGHRQTPQAQCSQRSYGGTTAIN